MALIAFRANRTLTQIESANAGIRQEIFRRDDLLDRLRSDVFRSGIAIRDYLLDSDPERTESQPGELANQRDAMMATLLDYQKNLQPEESARVGDLQRALTEYWNTLEPLLQMSPQAKQSQSGAFLRNQILPRRQKLLQLVNDISAIDAKQLEAGEEQMASDFMKFRRQLLGSSLLIIAIGLAAGVAVIRRVLGLEHAADLHFQEVVHSRIELQRLTAKLVAAEEEERRRLSRELHDQIGQHMSAALVELGNVEAMLPEQSPELRERMFKARRLAELSVAKVRNMALLLRPSMLDDLGLAAALRWRARETSRTTGVKVEVATDGIADDLPNEHSTSIYRVVEEAINNSIRHAHPNNVRVTVRQEPTEIRVTIADDGAGFDPRQEKGMGLLGMEERIQGLGGILRVDSELGKGTAISILLPLAQMAPAEQLL